jgi:hypothetical protein
MSLQTRNNHTGAITMKQFIETNNRKKAEKEAPWAYKIVKVEGGYMAFEFENDYLIWKNQK